MLPPKSEFTEPPPSNNVATKSMTDSYISESRARRRQHSVSRPPSSSHTMVEPTTVVATNDDDVFLNANESEVQNRNSVEKLTYYFEQHEKESEKVYQHDEMNNEFTSLSNSAPDITNINIKQNSTTTVVS